MGKVIYVVITRNRWEEGGDTDPIKAFNNHDKAKLLADDMNKNIDTSEFYYEIIEIELDDE